MKHSHNLSITPIDDLVKVGIDFQIEDKSEGYKWLEELLIFITMLSPHFFVYKFFRNFKLNRRHFEFRMNPIIVVIIYCLGI